MKEVTFCQGQVKLIGDPARPYRARIADPASVSGVNLETEGGLERLLAFSLLEDLARGKYAKLHPTWRDSDSPEHKFQPVKTLSDEPKMDRKGTTERIAFVYGVLIAAFVVASLLWQYLSFGAGTRTFLLSFCGSAGLYIYMRVKRDSSATRVKQLVVFTISCGVLAAGCCFLVSLMFPSLAKVLWWPLVGPVCVYGAYWLYARGYLAQGQWTKVGFVASVVVVLGTCFLVDLPEATSERVPFTFHDRYHNEVETTLNKQTVENIALVGFIALLVAAPPIYARVTIDPMERAHRNLSAGAPVEWDAALEAVIAPVVVFLVVMAAIGEMMRENEPARRRDVRR